MGNAKIKVNIESANALIASRAASVFCCTPIAHNGASCDFLLSLKAAVDVNSATPATPRVNNESALVILNVLSKILVERDLISV